VQRHFSVLRELYQKVVIVPSADAKSANPPTRLYMAAWLRSPRSKLDKTDKT
jgi:hypothetical protein